MRHFLFVCMLLLASPAQANWYSNVSENPFEKTTSAWVFTVSPDGYGFGLACDGPNISETRLVFVTIEEASGVGIIGLNRSGVTLSIIVDDTPRVDLVATADIVDLEGSAKLRLSASGEDVMPVAAAISAARRRVSVAAVFSGQTFHVTNFGVSGSRRHLQAGLEKCGVPQSERK